MPSANQTITIRNLPSALSRLIRKRARQRRISLNRAVIELLQEGTGEGRDSHPDDDLDFIIGAWTKDEADAFERDLARQRAIDPELWK